MEWLLVPSSSRCGLNKSDDTQAEQSQIYRKPNLAELSNLEQPIIAVCYSIGVFQR